ncbi:MAG: DNA alkylation repair protein [Paludibacteraceae bacterium]|nr:DNA alkylation repair protein [Paludibacteraceae bacterium]
MGVVTAEEIEETLLGMADEKKAKVLMGFFKTGKGEYGEGDIFLGINNPNTRLVVKEAWKDTPLDEAEKLVHSKWHEVRLCGLLIMVAKFEKALKKKNEAECEAIYKLYISLHKYINNWDLVDLTAPRIVGPWSLLHPEDCLMDEWIKADKTLWQQRISMVSCWLPIRKGIFAPALERAKVLLTSKEDLLHKVSGWMLREVGKHGGMEYLEDFLDANVKFMSSTMLRYAIEKLDESSRQMWLKRRRE